jgi:hypothetical protein
VPDIILTREDIEAVVAAAKASSLRYSTGAGHYANTLLSHLVGRAGEAAAEKQFDGLSFPVKPHWRDPALERLCDLQVSKHRIEVKTWSQTFWDTLGRCVAVGQFDAVAKKAGSILWATVNTPLRTAEAWEVAREVVVELRGYSTMRDVRAAPVRRTGPRGREVENYQVEGVRPFGRLVDAITRTVPCGFCATLGCVGPHVEEIHW